MLKQADFYILKQQDEQARRRFACRLTQKVFRNEDMNIAILTANQAESALLDELLWTFDDISFIPHDIAQQFSEERKIIITHQPLTTHSDLILNLSDNPINSEQTKRVCEVIVSSPESTQKARARYKTYQTQQVALNTYKI